MEKSLRLDRFQLGVCYYPEQWPEELWADDFRRMRELGFSVIRVAEFAWSIFEPTEGTFSFDLFDRAIDLAHDHGLQVIVGTPTATPPAWLTHTYPEVLNVTQTGVQYQHGMRRHYTYNAPIYRDLSARIVRKMAEHYGGHPAVIGWQIDNELNCEVNVFYSAADQEAFCNWLRTKYGSLEQLNLAWGAVFWSQTYSDWAQVKLAGPTPSGSPNPHQALDEKRFFSDSAIAFARLQADILRELAPTQWVTTNGIFGHLDSHQLTEEMLDFISYDSYPNFSTILGSFFPHQPPDPLLDRRWSWLLSVVRSISPHFCVMEQQSGPGGWTNRIAQPSPKPGQMRLWTYQSIAHGADMVLYFRWRTATMGTEIYWHGINDYHNRPNRRVAEVAQIGRELEALATRLVATRGAAQIALVSDYDNEWDGELDGWHGPYARQSVNAWVTALQYGHIPADALYLRPATTLGELAKYRVLVYPHPAILTDATADLLTAYVRQGGTIVFGCRTGYKDTTGQCYMRPMPGPVADLCGVTVADFTRIEPSESAPTLRWRDGDDAPMATGAFNDILQVEAPGAEVLAEYAGSYYAGAPALVRNGLGNGSAYYYGGVFSAEVAGALIPRLGLVSPVGDWLELPQPVELCVRESAESGERLIFLLNYSDADQTVTLHKEATDALSGKRVQGSVALAPFDVLILLETA
ncbi:MAG: beta-galactosidase [Chloroflexales bacterium]|nr:beta-galactosidase [Chloroflexales bacterium]